jgi:hypothetical protein
MSPVDQEKITVKFPDAFTLMEYLRGTFEQQVFSSSLIASLGWFFLALYRHGRIQC